jgi:hypothetical protein
MKRDKNMKNREKIQNTARKTNENMPWVHSASNRNEYQKQNVSGE